MEKYKYAKLAMANHLVAPANKIYSHELLQSFVDDFKGKTIDLFYNFKEDRKIGVVKNLKMFGNELLGDIYLKTTKYIKENYLTPVIFIGIRKESLEVRAGENVYTVLLGDLMSIGLCARSHNPFIERIKIR